MIEDGSQKLLDINSMPIIRPTLLADIEDVARLSELWAVEDITLGHVPTSAEQLRAQLGQYFWVAEDAGQIIGFAYGSVHTSEGLAVIPAGEIHLEIDEVYVHPDYRCGGIGGQLVDRLLDEAGSHGLTRFLLMSANKDWQRTVSFYQKHGFKMWYVQMHR